MKKIKEIYNKIDAWLHPKFVIISSIWHLITETIAIAFLVFLAWVVIVVDVPAILMNKKMVYFPVNDAFEAFMYSYPLLKVAVTVAGIFSIGAWIIKVFRDNESNKINHLDKENIEDIILDIENSKAEGALR